MKTKLLTCDELRKRVSPDDGAADDAPPETNVCTIAELFDLAELVRKGKHEQLPREFLAATQRLLKTGEVCIESLDLDRLHRNMFDDHRNRRPGLWPPANDLTVSVGKTVRRLILRVSEVTWWDHEVYEEMDRRACPQR